MGDPTTAARPVAYSYQRFSSPAQWSGDSITRQHLMAAEYAKAHDLHLDESLTIRDLGVSGFRGKNAETGALAKFLQAVHSQHVPSGSFLLIECLDRLSRAHILMAQSLLSQLILAGINVVSLVDRRIYSAETLAKDPISLLYALIVFARANEESAMKSVRAREAWKRKREAPKSPTHNSSLTIRRVVRIMGETTIQDSDDAMETSQSLARRRHRLNHARSRLTTPAWVECQNPPDRNV
jgi:DNA invertase Pin-like site-specific DNA recombinase